MALLIRRQCPHLTLMINHRPLPFSESLLLQLRDGDSPRISLQELLDGVKTRARATLLILFALPNLIPAGIPGTSAITGLPLVFLTLQMMLGSPVWLPRFIAGRSFDRAGLVAGVLRVQPHLQKIERVLRPRMIVLSQRPFRRVIGGFGLTLAVLIMLPIPLANFLPALAIIVMGLGLLEEDGVFLMAGIAIGAGAVLLVFTVYWALILAGLQLWITATD